MFQFAHPEAFQGTRAQPKTLLVAIGQLLLDQPLPAPCQSFAYVASKTSISNRAGTDRRKLAIEPGRRLDSNQVADRPGRKDRYCDRAELGGGSGGGRGGREV